KAEAEVLADDKKVLQEGLNNQVLEAEKIREELARQQKLATEKEKALTEAKAKQEQLEKELGTRQKTRDEKDAATGKEISTRMEKSAKLAGAIMSIHVMEYGDGDAESLRGLERKDRSWCKNESFALILAQLTMKIYDELKVAEEAEKEKPLEKPKPTDEELKRSAEKAAKIACKQGQVGEVDAALAAVILQELLK
ncbi:MAG: hypothetical protein Q8L24_01695, partial [bacterium]|nr:hypothetical protein [bacterium]